MNTIELARRIAASRIPVSKDISKEKVYDAIEFPECDGSLSGTLLEHQIDHTDQLTYMLNRPRCNAICDTSPTGRGKTYTAACCAKRLGLPVIVLCVKSAISTWYRILKLWGVPIVSITNYDMIRSSHTKSDVKWYDMRNGYTETTTTCPMITKKIFGNDVMFIWKLSYKCLIIFDEEQVGKNPLTQTFKLFQGAVRASKAQGHKLLFLSATPIEKSINLKSIMYFLGLIQTPDMTSVRAYFKALGCSDIKEDMKDIHAYLYNKEKGFMASMPKLKETGLLNEIRPITYSMDSDATQKIAKGNMKILAIKDKLKRKEYSGALGALNENRCKVEKYKVPKVEELVIAALRGEFPWTPTTGSDKGKTLFVDHSRE